ncbi:DJ-1/PfpI family protein [Paraglaciecola hydrolytica]|uniref:DJ-1/PfpI family protein n=1 Tax=Paraglaciecola hydrolytica TaxID=1799789 RepID=UPI000A961FB5
MAIKIGIYIYEDAEVLDFSGPFEVFTTASRVSKNGLFEVFLIAETTEIVKARAGYKVVPDYGFSDHPVVDVLIVVGGDHSREIHKTQVIEWIALQAQQCSLVASVCTGAFLLAQAQVITDQQVTTHWEDLADLKQSFPALDVVSDVRWVDQGNIVTSGGISAGIDMSLHLVSKLHSEALAQRTAKQMEFLWLKNDQEKVQSK